VEKGIPEDYTEIGHDLVLVNCYQPSIPMLCIRNEINWADFNLTPVYEVSKTFHSVFSKIQTFPSCA
jgi:hypothetical protein